MGRARNLGVWTQRIAIGVVVAVIVGFAVRVGSSSTESLSFRDPLIWLVSTATGQVVQADAGSGDVTARVEVGKPGDSLMAVQHGHDALVLNRSTGELARIDGSQLKIAERTPVQVDPNTTLLARGDNAGIVTPTSVQPVDPATAGLGQAVDVEGLTSPVLDERGTIWGLDAQRDVVAVSRGVSHVRVPAETRPFAVVGADGTALLVDGSGPVLRTLESPQAGLGADHCIGGPIGVGVVVGGSVDSASRVVVMVDPATGIVRMSDLDHGCTNATIQQGAGARYGAPVESGGFAYVPILSTGEVVVIQVDEGTVVNRLSVTAADSRLELTVKDHTVWFNDPDRAAAGVLTQEGLKSRVDKFNQVEVSGATTGNAGTRPPATGGTVATGSGQGTTGVEPRAGEGPPGSAAGNGQGNSGGGVSARTVSGSGSASGPAETGDLSGLVADFTYSKRVVEVGESVRFVDRSQGGPTAWTWDFGDGSFDPGTDVSHAWSAIGAYTVTLTVDSESASASASATIEVIDENTRTKPSADFRYSASRVEVGQPVTFTDRTTGNASELRWDFGDGSTASDKTIEHSWSAAGSYRVALTATNPLGSDTSEPVTITVFDRVDTPTAAIGASATNASVNETVTFTSRSTGNPTELTWDFGDGSTARGDMVSHAWKEPGNYRVRLSVRNSAGRSDATVDIAIDNRVVPPVARLVASSTTAEAHQTIRFTSLSINRPIRFTWDFGDGATDSGTNVTHAYDRPGRYTVTLRVGNGAGEDTATLTIVVVSDIAAPVAAFGFTPDSPVSAGVPVQFQDQSTGGAATSWSWDFGDGTAGSALRNPTHLFTTEGTYTVRLVVENGGGRDEVTRRIQVRPPQPQADFSWSPMTPNAGDLVQFTDATQGGTPDSWSWDFGDGATSTERNPRHAFVERRPYDVKLTVTNDGGTSTRVKRVEVNPRAPVAAFTYSPQTNITTATGVQFNDASTGGPPDTYEWNFGDGTPLNNERNPRHTFPRAGTFPVTLTVRNGGGSNSTQPLMIRVTVPPPTATFTVGATRLAGQAVSFSSAGSQGAQTYEWNFGDGTAVDTRANPPHVFATARDYTVTLIVRNQGVPSVPFSQTFHVFPVPTADFNIGATRIAGQPVTFTNSSTGGDTYEWNFGDGSAVDTRQSPTHVFKDAKSYDVTLTVRNGGGGETSVTHPVTINPTAPKAGATAAQGTDGTITFHNTSTGAPFTRVEWDWGDGTPNDVITSGNMLRDVTHTFVDGSKPHTVTLTVTNATGSDPFTITIPARPVAQFDWSPDPLITTTTDVTFTNRSGAGAEVVEWQVDGQRVGTGNTYRTRFTAAGTYQVTLIVRNLWGNSAPVTHTVTVV